MELLKGNTQFMTLQEKDIFKLVEIIIISRNMLDVTISRQLLLNYCCLLQALRGQIYNRHRV